MQDYAAIGEDCKQTLQGYLDDNAGWETAKKAKGVTVDFKPSPCAEFVGGNLYRGQMEINCPKETVKNYIDPMYQEAKLRKRWDKDVRELTILKSVDTNIWILHTLTNSAAMGLISPRDFVDVLVKEARDDVIITCGMSVHYPDCESTPKYVRGWNYPCGNICADVPGKPGHTRVLNFIQPDIKGMLPRSLVDGAIPASIVAFFNNLRDILKKDGHLKS